MSASAIRQLLTAGVGEQPLTAASAQGGGPRRSNAMLRLHRSAPSPLPTVMLWAKARHALEKSPASHADLIHLQNFRGTAIDA